MQSPFDLIICGSEGHRPLSTSGARSTILADMVAKLGRPPCSLSDRAGTLAGVSCPPRLPIAWPDQGHEDREEGCQGHEACAPV
jgi:hypothetical protein